MKTRLIPLLKPLTCALLPGRSPLGVWSPCSA
jgi:hypothetical protein